MALFGDFASPMDAVTENNCSFGQPLTAGEAVWLCTTNQCCYPSHLPSNCSQQEVIPSKMRHRYILPLPPTLPAAEIAWTCPHSHMASKLHLDDTAEEP